MLVPVLRSAVAASVPASPSPRAGSPLFAAVRSWARRTLAAAQVVSAAAARGEEEDSSSRGRLGARGERLGGVVLACLWGSVGGWAGEVFLLQVRGDAVLDLRVERGQPAGQGVRVRGATSLGR